jgi:RHH-type proline utilization regulon transcriptional repressor/proline dehydrogenase/delta 1-pyrroline-5-carboxylate dehydrogenase
VLLPRIFETNTELRKTIHQHYRCDEEVVLNALLPLATLDANAQSRVNGQALELAGLVRTAAKSGSSIQNLLNQYALSTNEGVVLMCLAEALLRVPDSTTADRLIRDRLGSGDWASHVGESDSLFVNSAAWGLLVSGRVVSFNQEEERQQLSHAGKLIGKLGEPVIRKAMRVAMGIMGTQFVLGRTIEEALSRAAAFEARSYCYSYDMLGEAARSMDDANGYLKAYQKAIKHIGSAAANNDIYSGAGISVKLSAIHPRYEFVKSERVMSELVPRLKALALLAKERNIGFTIDAEEADRLEISLDVIEAVFADPDLNGWEGFGIVVQAYQKRALPVLQWVIDLSRRVGRKMMLRLVKGAYWDSEIKIAQVEGLTGYPVFTRKASTDVSYQACAGLLLDNRDVIYPQFATHNAYSVAYVLERAGAHTSGFEFQRLHGMGDGLYDKLVEEKKLPVRIYAPVGEHKSLLAYLVRRLLENGANSSFVNNIVDDDISLESLIEDPADNVRSRAHKINPNIPLPIAIYGADRKNSAGVDLSDVPRMLALAENVERWARKNIRIEFEQADGVTVSRNPADRREVIGFVATTSREELSGKLDKAAAAYALWSSIPVQERALCLQRLGDKLEQYMDEFIALCTREAGKISMDGVAEVREAVDFCRYYANEGRKVCGPHPAWNEDGQLESRGVAVCISPWNFPLAIFMGQVTAALAAGNSVLAKPADSTCLIATRAIELMAECGFPADVVQLIVSDGPTVGDYVLPDHRVAAVMFTGSTAVGAWISRKLAQRPGPRIPLIAETGGQNCLIVDSTALPEQVVDDVISSGFQSAGQRCSALRVLFLQNDIADEIIAMIIGAMKELEVGNPALLRTDIGPVIDQKALSALNSHVEFMKDKGKLLYQCELPEQCSEGTFFAPRLYEISAIGVLEQEVFGPVVHVVRYKAKELDQTLTAINSTGFGLTCGVHSRIHTTVENVIRTVEAGNIYVNRNIIGAIVGVQPFGGHGLSGTGPKAGGPSYVYRLAKQKVSPASDVHSLNFNFTGATVKSAPVDVSAWKEITTPGRVERIKRLVSLSCQKYSQYFEESLAAQVDTMSKEVMSSMAGPQTLPGPTGELNQLLLEPRGTLLCIQKGSGRITDSMRQVVAALLCGNTVIHVADQPFDISDLIKQAGLESAYRRVTLNSELELEGLLKAGELQAAAICAPEILERWVDGVLATRKGALRPLIIETSGPSLIQRFVLEKATSNNTTASGGNASLLAMGDS